MAFGRSLFGRQRLGDAGAVPGAGVVFDAAVSSGYKAAQSNYSFNHTVTTQANRFLEVCVSLFAAGTVSGITYNGVALTQNASATVTNGVYRNETWYLIAPATGVNSVAVTLSGLTTSSSDAASYYNTDQQKPIEATATNSGTNTPATVSVTTITSGAMVTGHLDVMTASGVTSATGQNSRSSGSGALGSSLLDDKGPVSTPAATTLTWNNIGVTDVWAASAMSIKPPTFELMGQSWF